MANAYAKRLRLRLFLEGVEIPVISANVQAGPNGPVVASIQIPPLAEGTRLLPRTIVHLFFLDMYSSDNPLIQVTGATGLAKNPSTYDAANKHRADKFMEGQVPPTEAASEVFADDSDAENAEYKVLFMGEVVGFQWTKNQSSRSLVLQCEDFSNYWDHAYQWNNTDIFGPGIKAVFSGGATNLFTDFLTSKGEKITQIVLSGRCNTFPKLTGLAAGLVRLLEAIGGSYYPAVEPGKVARKFAGQNLFFSLAELRLHLTHMVASIENDPTSNKLLRYQGYSGMMDRLLGGMGGQTSIRSCITALSGIIFYGLCAQPCPYYIPGVDGTVSGKVQNRFVTQPNGKLIGGVVTDARESIVKLREDITETTAQPDVKLLDKGANGYARATADRALKIAKLLNALVVQAKQDRAPSTVTSLLAQSARSASTAGHLLAGWSPRNSPKTLLGKIDKNLESAAINLGRVLDVQVSGTTERQKDPARIAAHIIKPDIWFGSPPRCNVLFPEDYHTIQYSRMFLQEPTRFLLKTNDEFFGEDELFDKFYFAPQGYSVKADQAKLHSILRNDLLDHELFTGILPVFEKMGEFNTQVSKSASQKKPNKAGPAQRSANFLYFKHRFNARQMQVSGKFNPYVAVGFPGVVIDKYVDRETIATYNELVEQLNKQPGRSQDQQLTPAEISGILGTNFLANFTQVTHSVSNQGSASTDYLCTYARQAEETVEFLGVERDSTVAKNVGQAVRSTDVAAVNPPKIYSLGPLGGRITNVTEVSSIYIPGATNDAGVTPHTSGQRLPLFERPVQKRTGSRDAVLVPIGQLTKGSQLVEVMGSEGPYIFRAYRVDEEVPRFRREKVDEPIEYLIKPGWYDNLWKNPTIGRAYEQFLGIGSITDPQQILDQSATSIGSLSEDQADALQQEGLAESGDDERVDAPSALALDENASIQQAVEFLVLTYSYIKQYNLDVDQFIRSYTWRPIATMVDIFGTSDLEFRKPDGGAVVRGYEGFHSRAFGPYEDIFGLVGPELDTILNIDRQNPAHVRADTRKRKLEAVQRYVSVLKVSRGILG